MHVIETTAGRCIFNDILPKGMPFYNLTMAQKKLSRVISDCFTYAGSAETVDLLDRIKDLGFRYATLAGLSFGLTDLKIPAKKPEIITETEKRVGKIQKNYDDGVLTERERYNQVIDAWTNARVAVTNEMIRGLKEDTKEDGTPYLNPIYLMTDSGARGSIDQIQQLAGMRALMAKPSGEIIETPIKSNFREGLTVLEYFSSTHGARKGLADTALKTANSGYLTRKLIDVAQNVIIIERDCGTLQGITKTSISRGDQVDIPLSQLIIGRTARDNIRNPITDEMIVHENEVITHEIARKIEALGLDAIRVRSPLTCDSPVGVCAKCYGWDMSTGRAGRGRRGRRHRGGPVDRRARHAADPAYVPHRRCRLPRDSRTRAGSHPYRQGPVPRRQRRAPQARRRHHGHCGPEAQRRDRPGGPEGPRTRQVQGSLRRHHPGARMARPSSPARSCSSGTRTERPSWRRSAASSASSTSSKAKRSRPRNCGPRRQGQGQGQGQGCGAKVVERPVVIEHKGDKHPQIMIEDAKGKILDVHYLPAGARIEVEEGQEVQAGQLLAHQPRATGGTQDITGGLPRVTEVFEARKPKDPAAMAEISGRVELRSDKRKGKMTITIRSESGMEKEHHVPRDRHLNVHTGDNVEAGDALTDGPLVPHDILRIKGEEALQRYLIGEIQNVYRSQNVNINDKHVEIIISQMMRKVEIDSVGDSNFLPGEVVDKFVFRRENDRLTNSIKIASVGRRDRSGRKARFLTRRNWPGSMRRSKPWAARPPRARSPSPPRPRRCCWALPRPRCGRTASSRRPASRKQQRC